MDSYFVFLSRTKPGESGSTQIATSKNGNGFRFADSKFEADYEPKLPATLLIKDVKRNEEYTYIFQLLNSDGQEQKKDTVVIDVVGK